MAAVVLDGRSLAADLSAKLALRARALRDAGIAPKLAVVIAGDDASSLAYLRNLNRTAARLGIDVAVDRLPERATAAEIRERLENLSADRNVHGVMLQQPLPAHLSIREVSDAIAIAKDVDGTHPANQGRLLFGRAQAAYVPATPLAVMFLLERSPHWPLRGRRAVVVGRSAVVGLPVAMLMLAADATVTILHSKSGDLQPHLQAADVVVAATGVPALIHGTDLKPGATVIDVGTTPVDGALKGDVDFDSAAAVAGAITPVPGGVGPVTSVALLQNVVEAAEGAGPSQR
ncbi:MAG TPA: bifunctional 5,10-methylenetetrahydrofolate dehydrogenase/5,10-methenyltetrahydrofolate cyclohydrolase [Candidatus Babeliales bacterium]|nr:bifunctional 5,10-methylenetetrahydrofolate dehydrogenase/5,10-methenyltetrahydrofolate cyclohydrolase [Candidatus Babeliales bacterium]